MARDPVSCSSRPGESRACPFQSEGRPCQAKLDQPPGISRGDSSQPQPEAHLQGLASKALLLLELERPPPTGHTERCWPWCRAQRGAWGALRVPTGQGKGGQWCQYPPHALSLSLLPCPPQHQAPWGVLYVSFIIKLLKGSLYKSRGFYLI